MPGLFNRKKSDPDGTDFLEKKESGDGSRNQSDATRSSRRQSVASVADRPRQSKDSNPLSEFTPQEVRQMGGEYAIEHGMAEPEDVRAFEAGAILAQQPEKYEALRRYEDIAVTEEEMTVLEKEYTSPYSQPKTLYLLVILCSLCAAVQGMDETVVNGAQLFYTRQFGIHGADSRSTWLTGLVNSAPYMCCALSCWLSVPFNNWFGRRGTVFVTCLFSALACFWQAFPNSWWHMFIARFALGIGIGPKSSTVPVYAAETAPKAIRGALVMQWQMWTAFGIMIGYVADLALFNVPDAHNITGLNWRLMMGSAMLPAVIVCCFVFLCPESPRWYMSKGRYSAAYRSMCRLRYNKIQAARDIFYMHCLLEQESSMKLGRNPLRELWTVPRNRHALYASEIVMFMQQFCGVNVIAYYSSSIFVDSGFSEFSALLASLGFGVINWVFAIPAVFTIDRFGRRNLLLTTFPLMAVCLLFTGLSFYIPAETHLTARVACIALGIYLFGIVYSPGEGPVPFTYSAEAYPLHVRNHGMSLATATTWFFNFVLSITWPSLLAAFRPQGAFAWYAGWNVVGFVLVLLFMRETKDKTLEELDRVFGVPTRVYVVYGIRQFGWFFRRYVLWNRDVVAPVLCEKEDHDEKAPGGENAV